MADARGKRASRITKHVCNPLAPKLSVKAAMLFNLVRQSAPGEFAPRSETFRVRRRCPRSAGRSTVQAVWGAWSAGAMGGPPFPRQHEHPKISIDPRPRAVDQHLLLALTVADVNDDELRQAIIEHLTENRATGAERKPLKLSDANLSVILGCDIDQLRAVLKLLIDEEIVHGKLRPNVNMNLPMEWDLVRFKEDPLPPPDPKDLD